MGVLTALRTRIPAVGEATDRLAGGLFNGKDRAGAATTQSAEHLRGLTGMSAEEISRFPELADWRLGQTAHVIDLERRIEAGDESVETYLTLANTLAGLSRFKNAQIYIDAAIAKFKAGDESPMKGITFFITERCNFRCKHCFIYDEIAEPFLRRSAELGTEEVVQIIENLRIPQTPYRNVYLSGGEVFARSDFEEILETIAKKGIPFAFGTNGAFPERLSDLLANADIKRMLTNVQFSLDGLPKSHDAIRGKGSFEKLARSIEIAKSHGIDTSAGTVIQDDNIGDLDAIAELVEEYGIDHHRFQLETKGRFLKTKDVGRFRHLIDARQFHMAMYSELAPGDGCLGGIRSCTIRPNGVVEVCRQSTVGNIPRMILGDLTEHDLDLDKMLRTDHAIRIMEGIKSCAGCAHYCGR
jgi:MoaA/NifB/PqqE/SkfB family radical SAM enzyme